jgi:tRNA (guanine37-N1)-methyltransferase
MNITIFSTHPNLLDSYLNQSILGRALSQNLWRLKMVNIHDYGLGSYKQVDDTPYGGGSGMVTRADVLGNAIDDNIDFKNFNEDCDKIIITSPRGDKFNQEAAQDFRKLKNLYIITNRFEGVDQRIIDYYNIKEVSIGDYILCGGELASMVVTESVVRLIPGVLGNNNSLKTESFANGNNIEHDHYTKPSIWNGMEVPAVLKSGNHIEIENWRTKNSNYKK